MDRIMQSRILGSLVALALATPVAVLATATTADAVAPKFSSCAKLNKVFPYGVAKSRAAAMRQVRDGNSRPAFGPRARAIYAENHRNLDRDHDGTACEG